MKILIVDDDPKSIDMLEIILKSKGHDVIVAENGRIALELAGADPPGMVISDILMPVMDGFQLCMKWKKDRKLKDIPFVFHTASYIDEKDKKFALELGADRFIKKPIEPDEFIRIIRDMVGDIKEGGIELREPSAKEDKEVFQLYSERLVVQLERKNLDLEKEIIERKRAEEALQKAHDEMEARVRERTKELEEANTRLIEASRLKSRFLSNMSHELRTPLNSVIALSGVLKRTTTQKLDPEEVEYLGVIERNGKRLLDLINDILDLSKIEAGHMDVALSFFPIKTNIEDILDSLQPLAEEKGLSLRTEIAPGLPKIQSDEKRVHQILVNLMGNAIKFTEKGEVAVLADSDADSIWVKVADSGIGIAEKDLSSIFEEFKQIDDSTTRLYEGTGLGLAIAYRVARNLGGDLSVESQPGQGATFTLSLPITWQGKAKQTRTSYSIEPSEMIAEPKTVLVADDEPKTADLVAGKAERPEKHGIKSRGEVSGPKAGISPQALPRILVIEDNPDNLLTIRAVLKDRYTIIEATDGEEGLKTALRELPDLILLDISLPGMDGYAVAKEIRANEKANRIPVIALTAHAMKGDRDKIISAGCNDYLSKPIDPGRVLGTIEKWLGNL